ncbi:MAG TPA: trifunctional glycosyltransferase/class I SAM-dependent methyltransferase/polysaccharide deacetylase [Vicinamibacterales bacterium]|jgi:peptidoglycan/xylan/chitin deacetylase (PgdA/CDA1 family)/glycosyltransferase involved in cell wall biosynthesis|nr:trifunctional glycosyltransferase/class I SAM-dependent methyltransferase/polysaccharide deacetylase [Vicinamibacterales bacterium]
MTPGTVAVIVTCHNLGRTLVEALESVERQTRPAAQIVVIDDRSTDIYTRQILEKLQRQGTRVATGTGLGASAARNLGARLTTAPYLVWLDADDLLEPTWLEAAAARLDTNRDLDFVSCALRAFGDACYVWTPSASTFVEAVSTGGVPHASTMIRRQLWEEVGGFDEGVPSFELLDFWASAFERGASGVVLEQPLLNYRVRPGSGYRRSIQTETYRSRLTYFYEKHRAAVARCGPELILGKEAFLQGQREYRRMLDARVLALEAELTGLQHDVAQTVAALESRGETRVDWGEFRRVQPLSQQWGWDRGKPVDRYYIEDFVQKHASDIQGRVLEVRDSVYTRRFGGDTVTGIDVLDIDPANSAATVIADLRQAGGIPSDTYDCIIVTQTLQLIDDVHAAIAELYRILRPGGVLLVTVPSVIRVDDEGGIDGDFWRFTEASARRFFAAVFPVEAFEVTAYGNVKSCAAFLYGMATEEVPAADLDHVDSTFPLGIAVRAVKPETTHGDTPNADIVFGSSRTTTNSGAFARTFTAGHRGVILSYHRIADLAPDSHGLCTPPAEFRAHMAFIRRECTPIALNALVNAAACGEIPERAVAVTLDDGYLDALTTASPILTELGVTATFFVNSDRLDREHERWWDLFEGIFLTQLTLPPVLTVCQSGHDVRLATATLSERKDSLERLNQIMWPLDDKARAEIVTDVLRWAGARDEARNTHRVLTNDEIRILADRPGHTIGAHTVHHLALTRQPADTRLREVLDNKAAIEAATQKPIQLFAYPYGEVDADLAALVSRAGFRAAVTVEGGFVTAGTNRLMLPRVEITASDRGQAFSGRLRAFFEMTNVC